MEVIDDDEMEGPTKDEERNDKENTKKKPEAKAPGKRTRRKAVTPKKKGSPKASKIPGKTRKGKEEDERSDVAQPPTSPQAKPRTTTRMKLSPMTKQRNLDQKVET